MPSEHRDDEEKWLWMWDQLFRVHSGSSGYILSGSYEPAQGPWGRAHSDLGVESNELVAEATGAAEDPAAISQR